MNNKLFAIALLGLPVLASAQKKDKAAMKAAATITVADLKKHLYTIASKEMEGRDTPSPGLEKAATYIEEHFKSLGLLPGNNGSYRQYYTLYKDAAVQPVLGVNGKTFEPYTNYQPIYTVNVAPSTFSEAVFAGYGITDGTRDDYGTTNVRGKIVIVLDGAPADYKAPAGVRGQMAPASSFGKINTALTKGAAGIMIVFNNFPRKASTMAGGWRNVENRGNQPPAMAVSISTEMAEAIMGEDGKTIFEKMKAGSLANKTYTTNIVYKLSKGMEEAKVSNVMGLLEGTDLKDEYVFITGHYDHLGKRDTVIYYGADDDGSGTTGVLEIAEAFAKAKKAGNGPRRSIVFMTVSGEEKGLWGSEYYSNHPVYPLEKTTVDLNIDMIGRSDASRKVGDSTNYIYVVGDDKLSSDLKIISEAANKKYTKVELDYKFNDPNDPNRIYFRSDHYNFAQKGVPIIFYYDGMLGADYHKPTDTPDKINYPLMAKRAQLVFYTAWEMANRNEMLKRDIKLEKPKGF